MERDESAKEQLRQGELLVRTRRLQKTSLWVRELDADIWTPHFKDGENISRSMKKIVIAILQFLRPSFTAHDVNS